MLCKRVGTMVLVASDNHDRELCRYVSDGCIPTFDFECTNYEYERNITKFYIYSICGAKNYIISGKIAYNFYQEIGKFIRFTNHFLEAGINVVYNFS